MLERLDLTQALSREEYVHELVRNQVALRQLAQQLYFQKRSLVVLYEGWDAAGKGSNIRRVTEKLDPRGYEVHSIAAPTGDERTHHYLWRFWRRIRPPSEKQVLIFDRSWYGRVLVERVEGFCSTKAWQRAYDEINAFERMLTDDGVVIIKFFLHIDEKTQLERFKAREKDPIKNFKIGPDDWRNRKRRPDYEDAIQDMFDRTHRPDAPWHVVPANDKKYARIAVLRTCVAALDA